MEANLHTVLCEKETEQKNMILWKWEELFLFENHTFFPSITRPDMGALFTQRILHIPLFLMLIDYAGATDREYIFYIKTGIWSEYIKVIDF